MKGLRKINEFGQVQDHPNTETKINHETLLAIAALRRDCIGATDITAEELKPR